MPELVVPKKFRRGILRRQADADRQRAGARYLLDMMCRQFAIEDFGAATLLDMGCGSKFSEALLGDDLPIGRYVGVDVYKDMIDFLSENVEDDRFEYHHFNAHNEMYNPQGELMTADSRLPLGDRQFDFICLFSVFTHLAPHDYGTMLKLLRRHIRPGGKLLYSVFINELTEGGHGLVDSITETLKQQGKQYEWAEGPVPDFVDAGKSPLQWALYSREHAVGLIEGTGWRIDSLNEPEEYVQHYFVLTPA